MPKITIRSTRRLRQQQIIASLLANGRTVSPHHMSPRLERHLREKLVSPKSINSRRALRLREVSFEDSLSPSTSSSSSEATLDSVIARDRDSRYRGSSSTSLSLGSRKRTRCSLSSLSPSVCLSSLADDTASSQNLNLPATSPPPSPEHRPTTPILEHRLSSGAGGGWGHFVDVVPPDDHKDSTSALPDSWSPFSKAPQQSPTSTPSPFAHKPYTLKRHTPEVPTLCFSRRISGGTAQQLQQASPPGGLTAAISSDGSESSSIQEHGAVVKALGVMSIS
mmetsp:Transcript_6323/g.8539  ORF Transcript_6323/g.8539 Transcript_6323/m.8539 type:complete len:279 (-) Transcript_6323:88-924(-)|eukprot:CAMPEP_0185737162 /NCGR_PEP_ID=MMETSP1171-20130828/29813_1 /TAXON_ID=374046 /ORGANISM="Helicotheca tamensis, Strain CCMP826" /LENGTH=278 /DNA_ID=CAMNT_0028408023 /DNA_START=47 /DNA_END=883 /DNA_ORIENTATION=+